MKNKNSGLQILEIEITNQCNLNCQHCYVDKNKKAEIKKEKLFDLIDQAKELKVYRLILTGGEPLLFKHLFEVAKYAQRAGIPEVGLMTNGLLITENNVKDLKVFDLIQLSLDVLPGDKPKFRIDYHTKLLEKISLLKKNNIPVFLQATLHKSMLPNLNRLADFAKKNKVHVGLNKLVPCGEAAELEKEIFTPEEYKQALKAVVKYRNKYIHCSDPLLFLFDPQKRQYYKDLKKTGIKGGCIAGVAGLYISAQGDVFPCAFLRKTIANIFKKDLIDIWFNNQILNKLRKRYFSGKCGSCQHKFYCGGCRATALIKGGDLFGSDPFCWFK